MSELAPRPQRQRWLLRAGISAAIALLVIGLLGQILLPVLQLHWAVNKLQALGVDPYEFREEVFPQWQERMAFNTFGGIHVRGPRVLDFSKIPVKDADLAAVRQFRTVINLDLKGQPITAQGLGYIQYLPIKWLTISDTRIGSGECQGPPASSADRPTTARFVASTLGSLRDLEALTAAKSRLADDDLSELPKLPRLEVVNLDDTCLTTIGMSHLSSIAALKFLYLGRTQVDDLGLRQLSRNVKLTELALNGTPVTGSGFAAFAGHSIQSLLLDDTKVDDLGMREIGRLQKLVKLNLARCPVTDQGCTSLAELKELRDLSLHGCHITDAALTTICKLEQLRDVDLAETQVTANGVGRLQVLKELLVLKFPGELLQDTEFVDLLTRFPNLALVKINRMAGLRLDLVDLRRRLGRKIFLEVVR